MAKITLMRPYRQSETLRLYEPTDIVELIRSDSFRELTGQLRSAYGAFELQRESDGSIRGMEVFTKKLPRICFASEWENHNHQRINRGYTGLVLLEVNNLTGYDEADAIRRGAGEIPQTLMAFVGASGRSVKIVCHGELFPSDRKNGEVLPETPEETADFHENLYERARLAYNGQLGVTIEKLEPRLDRTCYASCDENIVYNPMAMPIYARAEKPTEAMALVKSTTVEPQEVSPGKSRYVSIYHLFEFSMERAYDDCIGITNVEERIHLLLTRLAIYCMETGIPMAIAKRITSFRVPILGGDILLMEKVFDNVYHDKHMKRYLEAKNIKLERNVPRETLMTMKLDIFLNENYEIRKNVMRGVAEFRERTGIGFSFRDLTEDARNSITMRAMLQGIKCWDKDIKRYVNSENIELYDPLNEFLENLPQWDGKDRVKPLADRIPTDYKDWPTLFHLWMRSMVAMWMGKGQLTGNALVPLLIGRQGCGKSSFCRILMPSNLLDYYNDRLNFKNENDLNLGLTSFGLINLDEFDKVTQRQQIVLKYLVSTADLKYRPPYGKAYAQHRRFASFIGTTNESNPLTDPSGSRRFVCVHVNGDIDFRTPIEYMQLYAQLRQEIRNGERYWPDRQQEEELMAHNRQYQQISGLGEMILSLIERPSSDQDSHAEWMSIKQLSAMLKKDFHGYQEDVGAFCRIGNFLNRQEHKFKSERKSDGMYYWVRLKK